MIKIKKDLENIPPSLVSNTAKLSKQEQKKTKTTSKRRMEIIRSRNYIDKQLYNDRYKTKDIRTALMKIYHNKCAYCESNEELLHIEHYRPKKPYYYWLAYSWDNLLVACHFCNINKNNIFHIENSFRASFKPSIKNILSINTLSFLYDKFENPKTINVENFDPYPYLEYFNNGKIRSNHPRVRHTINICDLNRVKLKDKRRRIIDDFRKEVIIAHREKDKVKRQAKLEQVIESFFSKTEEPERSFLALRRYLIDKKIIYKIIKSVRDEYTVKE
ncbi:HNH endonuclease [Acinetobacter baumannii]|uniref:HNH endonuclease n=1 Tax=Acinetobacter baumannii TaxID=470 RepID=UPI0013183EB5|nr:HNH endonuclease [Acinetobacter baumannii]MDC5073120.1 hypothetical protein [Acinetobacter baumannii]MDC5255117.1 hypothetical protein [Acinetobacter baumannii]QHB90208.1 hypothetical protein F9K57_07210 [Acinetobacter baumannii]HBY7913549.1 hypothetical protein [Acinetobacter baumannii]HBY9042951.1 hypothetical protein [Acinetobacter baumannii]